MSPGVVCLTVLLNTAFIWNILSKSTLLYFLSIQCERSGRLVSSWLSAADCRPLGCAVHLSCYYRSFINGHRETCTSKPRTARERPGNFCEVSDALMEKAERKADTLYALCFRPLKIFSVIQVEVYFSSPLLHTMATSPLPCPTPQSR